MELEKIAAAQSQSNWLTLNIGGMVFRTELSKLQRFPETLLGSITTSSEYYNEDTATYVFDRNPYVFQHILDFYHNEHLHFPSTLCGSSIQNEIRFWQISETNIATCCWGKFLKEKKQDEVLAKLDSDFDTVDRFGQEGVSNGQCTREKIWLLLEDSASSCGAKVKAAIYIILVYVSLSLLSLETIPAFKHYYVAYGLTNNTIEEQEPRRGPSPYFYYAECAISLLFTKELVLRFVVCPNKKKFLLNFLNVINLLVNLMQLVVFIVILLNYYDKFSRLWWIFSCCRLFRILLVYKIARHFTSTRVFTLALKNSIGGLLWTLLFFSFISFAFAAIVYTLEMNSAYSHYRNIREAVYWATITMTTVGYGDMMPLSLLGKNIAGICSIVGILFIGVMMSIILANFNTFKRQTEMKIAMEEKGKSDRKDVKSLQFPCVS